MSVDVLTGAVRFSHRDVLRMKGEKCCLTCKTHLGAGCTNPKGIKGVVGDYDWCNAWKKDHAPIRAVFGGGL